MTLVAGDGRPGSASYDTGSVCLLRMREEINLEVVADHRATLLDRNAVAVSSMIELAGELGLRAAFRRFTWEDLQETVTGRRVFALLNNNNVVILMPSEHEREEIGVWDPLGGDAAPFAVKRADLERNWDGRVLIITPQTMVKAETLPSAAPITSSLPSSVTPAALAAVSVVRRGANPRRCPRPCRVFNASFKVVASVSMLLATGLAAQSITGASKPEPAPVATTVLLPIASPTPATRSTERGSTVATEADAAGTGVAEKPKPDRAIPPVAMELRAGPAATASGSEPSAPSALPSVVPAKQITKGAEPDLSDESPAARAARPRMTTVKPNNADAAAATSAPPDAGSTATLSAPTAPAAAVPSAPNQTTERGSAAVPAAPSTEATRANPAGAGAAEKPKPDGAILPVAMEPRALTATAAGSAASALPTASSMVSAQPNARTPTPSAPVGAASSKTVRVCGEDLPLHLDKAGSRERYPSLVGVWTGNWSNEVCAGLIVSNIAQNGAAKVTYTYKVESRSGQNAQSYHQDVSGSVANDGRLFFRGGDGAYVSFVPNGKNHLKVFYSRRTGRYSETIFEKLL